MHYLLEENCHFDDQTCRLCLSDKNSIVSLFKTFADNGNNLGKMLNDIIGMNAKPGDGLPENVCFECLDDIRRYCIVGYKLWNTLCYLIQMNNEKEEFNLNEVEMPKDNIEFLFRKSGNDVNDESTQSAMIYSNSRNATGEEEDFQVQYCWCSDCNEDFICVEDLRIHLDKHREERFCYNATKVAQASGCEVVKNSFESKHVNTGNKLCCARCGRVFKDVKGLSAHVNRYDFKCKPKQNEDSFLDLGIVSGQKIKCFNHSLDETVINRKKCTSSVGKINELFTENASRIKKTLDDDISVHLPVGSESCCDTIEQMVSFFCDYCRKPHDNKKILRYHIVQCHLSFNKQYCPKCLEVFFCDEDLEKHCNSHRSDEKFFCSVCKSGFISRQVLINHMNEFHEPERVFLCSVCHNGFKSRADLGVHHSLNYCSKNFTCSSCCHKFLSRNAYNVHRRLCHLKLAPFSCDICHKVLSTKNNLEVHKLIHANLRPFQCHVCLKFFSSSGQRYAHVRSVHMKIKPYECGICNRKFSFKRNLNMHYAVHSDQRPHKCYVCEKSFKYKCNLNAHAKNHGRK